MDSTDIVKKRLNDLKKLSQNLKQSTQICQMPDVNLIKAIINITKVMPHSDSNTKLNQSVYNFSTKHQHNQSNQIMAVQGMNKMGKKMSLSGLNKHLAKTHSMNDILLNDLSMQPLFPQPPNHNFKKQSSPTKYSPPRTQINQNLNQQQLIHLRQENNSLQQQLKQMKDKLNFYKQKQQQQNQKTVQQQRQKQKQIQKQRQRQMREDDDDWVNNTAPYFKLNQQVLLFTTKITIDKSDYQKVQYTYHPLKLTLDRIVLQRIIRKSPTKQNRKDSSSSTTQNIVTKQQFNLSHLIQVQYLDNDKILLIFGNQNDIDTKTRLFLQFDDHQTMHRWDLAIYINFKIINNLNTQRLFIKQKNTKKDQNQPQSNRSSIVFDQSGQSGLNPADQKLALKRYLDNKKKYIQSQKQLKQIMLHKIIDLKGKQKQNNQMLLDSLMFSKNQSERGFVFKRPEQNNSQINNLQTSLTIGTPNKNIQNRESNPENQMHSKQVLQNMYKKNNTQSENISDSKKNQQKESRMKQLEQQNKKRLEHRKKVDQALNVLKNGMFMTKYTKSAFNPHQKRVFISEDYQKFCWQDKDSNQFKFIKITEISSIHKGQIGEGVEKHVGRKKIKNLGCFILINTSSKDRKTLQFGMKSLKLMQQFSESLLLFMSELKQGHLDGQQ